MSLLLEFEHDVGNFICELNYTQTGTKNVNKQLRKVTEGRVRDRGVTWFPLLTDKSECMFVL